MKSKKNIVLIGMMGSGKSTIGIILSKKLKRKFIDIDVKVQETEGMTISLGGGGFTNLLIRKRCQKTSLSFWLNWKNETIIARIYKSKKRPLVMKLKKEEINNLIKERSKVYELSDHKINCDKLDKDQIINKIIDIYENK